MRKSLAAAMLGAVLILTGCTATPEAPAESPEPSADLVFVTDTNAETYPFDFSVAGPEGEELVADTITVQGADADLMAIMDWYFAEKELNFVHDGQVVSTLLDLESDKEKGWMVYVNDEMAQVGAADLVPAEGDEIQWRYVTYSELDF